MKTIQELYKEVMASDELKKALLDAAKDGKLMDFLKANGCDATEEELKAFLEKYNEDKELTADELDNVAGRISSMQAVIWIRSAQRLARSGKTPKNARRAHGFCTVRGAAARWDCSIRGRKRISLVKTSPNVCFLRMDGMRKPSAPCLVGKTKARSADEILTREPPLFHFVIPGWK